MTNCNDCQQHRDSQRILPDWKRVFVNRQEFLKLLSLTLGGLISAVAVIPGFAFLVNYLFTHSGDKWIALGPKDKFKEGETVDVVFDDPAAQPWDGCSARRSVWLRRDENDKFTAFAITCTHLGCPVKWEAGPQLFMCPCHGGVYYNNGDVAGGPPPRPLRRYPIRIKDDVIEISVGQFLPET
ncbi:MAG: Rieske 2Fe-2S domain-containing protein [Cyanobacteria bacterium SZAS-4]|nr:Rieske 2Fe-2S domain-containing protein [Cyanobacteria bacterium SZAS-4]